MTQYNCLRGRSGSRDGLALVIVLSFIVLMTILIVSFIAFTRLNRMSTASYSKSIQAQEIAQGGMQDILGDLHSEIVAGSLTNTATYVVGSGSYARVYVPSTNYTASPAHLGYDATAWGTDVNTPQSDNLSPTLLRVSRASQDSTATDFFPPLTNAYYDATLVKNLLNRASKSSTATPSINGRYISPSRWNKTFFVACSSTTNESDSPYCMPGVFVSTNYLTDANYSGAAISPFTGPSGPPDWVYVTRAGSRVCTNSATELPLLLPTTSLTNSYTVTAGQNPPASPIVGRYAYVMFDEGATLDVGAAGFYSSPQTYTSTNVISTVSSTVYPQMTQTIMGKSSLPAADLSISPLLQNQANVNAFVAFRNGSLASPSNSTYLNAAFNYAQKGFLNFQSGDSPLVSRQDLINYFAKADSTFNTDNGGSPGISRALPYLGTFSRAVSAPSWSPPVNASVLGGVNGGSPGLYSYHDNAEVSTASPFSSTSPNPNRDMANVRWPTAGTISHYTDDATAAALTYKVNVGDPLLASRFSLAKIAWLSQANPDTGAAPTNSGPILACFGLKWGVVGTYANGGNACWSYAGSPAGPSGTLAAFNGTIETLDQVAKEGREPNFFELLKAAILSGSVGVSPGPSAFVNGTGTNFDYHGNNGNYLVSPATPTTTNPATPIAPNAGSDGLYSYTFDGHNPGGSGTVQAPGRITDMQIMQIGANIIDQFDADSYPTAIYFQYAYNGTQLSGSYDAASATSGVFGQMDMVYGDENIPDLNAMDIVSATVDGLPNGAAPPNLPTYPDPGDPDYVAPSANTTGFSDWWQPVLWNFHQMPNPANPASSVPPPKKYAIKGYGAIKFAWSITYMTTSYIPGTGAHAGFRVSNPATQVGGGGTTPGETMDDPHTPQVISFTDTAPTTSAFYANPVLLTKDQLPNVTATTSLPDMTANSTIYDYVTNHFVGFWGGNDPSFPGTDYSFVNVSATTAGPATFVLGWVDSGGGFHPYSFIPGIFSHTYGVVNNGPAHVGAPPVNPQGDADPAPVSPEVHMMIDPRTSRMSSVNLWEQPDNETFWMNNNPTYSRNVTTYGWGQPTASQFKYFWVNQYGFPIEDWAVNQSSPLAVTGATATYYNDMDGVIRPGDGAFGNYLTGDGMLLYMTAPKPGYPGVGAGQDGTALGDTVALSSTGTANDKGSSYHGRRSVVLNRPFRNVGELGYTFRDLPFKTLDFFSTSSADAALLDVFSTTDEAQISSSSQISAIVAGRVDPNNAPTPVLQAILGYGAKKDYDPTYNMLSSGTNSNAKTQASKIASQLSPATGTGPISSRAGLVTQLGAKATTGVGAIASGFSNAWDKENKSYLESPVRALSNITNARTWNLMVDIIAQSGHLSPTAKTLDNFVVEGERRYWLHVAIDRYTGKIVDQQLEPVYE